MSEIQVTFKSGNIEKSMGVSPNQTIGEFREGAQMLLSLPEDPPCKVVLERTDEILKDDLLFKDLNIQKNDKIVLIQPTLSIQSIPPIPPTSPSPSIPKLDLQEPLSASTTNPPNMTPAVTSPNNEPNSGLKDLYKPIITSSIVGIFIVVGLALSKYISTPPSLHPQTSNPISTISPASSPSIPPVSTPFPYSPLPLPPISSPVIRSNNTVMRSNDTNAIIVGQAGKKNIRRGPGLEYGVRHIAYPGDRVQIIESTRNSDNFPWYHVYFPKSRADGWIAGNLIAVDGQSPSQIPSQPHPNPPSSSGGTNATVGGAPGTKNIRSGAGTIYGVVGKIRTGDRVQILGSSYDQGGYQWYNIYDPQSGTKGWIAAQLINHD